MRFFFRRRKTALRTPDNYTHERLMADHAESTALFSEATGHAPVPVDEQQAQADAEVDLTVDNDEPVADVEGDR